MKERLSSSTLLSLSIALLVAVALTATAACSGKESDKKKEAVAESELKECKGVDLKKTDELPPKCAEALFAQRISATGSKELAALDDAKVMEIGHGICSLASAIASDPTQSADFDQMIKANSKNWGIGADSVRKVIDKATVLCPDSMARLKQLTKDQGPTTVTLEATGSAKVQVSYRGTDADKSDQVVDPPWTKDVTVSKAGTVELIVFPSATSGVTTGCRMTVAGIEVASAQGGDGEMAVCSASQGQIRAARSGQPVTQPTQPAEPTDSEPAPSDQPPAGDTPETPPATADGGGG